MIGVSVILMVFILFQIRNLQNRIAADLLKSSIHQTKSELNGFFKPIENLMNSVRQQREFGLFLKTNIRERNLLLYPIIEQHPQISSIGLADSSGYELNVIPDSIDGVWLNREVHVDRWGYLEKWYHWEVQDSIRVLDTWEKKLLVDPRERPWFKEVLKYPEGDIVWTAPYQYVTSPDIGITATIRVKAYDEQKRVATQIIAFDLTLHDLSKFSETLDLTENQHLYLFTEKDSIIVTYRQPKTFNYANTPPLDSLVSLSSLKVRLIEKVMGSNAENIPVKFDDAGEEWWGISSTYPIGSHQNMVIISALPAKDFSVVIYQTKAFIIFSFVTILLLGLLMVKNGNRISKLNGVLSQQNVLINEQKEFLFSEVHHRVKNNLALISAFNELDAMADEEKAARQTIQKIQERIKVIAIVQEHAYSSEELGKVQTTGYLNGIVNYKKKNLEVSTSIEEAWINTNQALTHSLFINEIFDCCAYGFDTMQEKPVFDLQFFSVSDEVTTRLTIHSLDGAAMITKLKDHQILEVLKMQLEAERTIDFETCSYSIRFVPKNKKGIMSNWL